MVKKKGNNKEIKKMNNNIKKEVKTITKHINKQIETFDNYCVKLHKDVNKEIKQK